MKRLFLFVAAVIITVGIQAADKMSFVVGGSEEVYNLIKVINETSVDEITCRVVIVEDDDNVADVYGIYNLKGFKDSDSHPNRIHRGTKLGIQLPKDFEEQLSFDVEYVDRPLFIDYIVIHLRDKESRFDDKL